jgi:Ca-activated chloride channel homolog
MIPATAKLFLTLVAFLCVSSFGQILAQQQNTESRVFHISVVDEDGKPYAGLKPENFTASVDKTPRKIVSLTSENTPVSVGILLDLSGSIGPAGKKDANAFRRKLSDAITHFLAISNPDNEYFAGTFNNRVAFSETWTGAVESIFEKLNAPENYGQTALYDALYHGIQHVIKSRHSRRVIVIVSDGLDNQSNRTFNEVTSLVKRSDVTIYALALYRKGSQGSSIYAEGLEVLNDLTKLSGGRTVFLKEGETPDVMKDAFGIVADNLREHYQIAIENEPLAGPEKWRKFTLKLDLPDEKGRPKLFIWGRSGFYQ